jgi:hypothetical protein
MYRGLGIQSPAPSAVAPGDPAASTSSWWNPPGQSLTAGERWRWHALSDAVARVPNPSGHES